ncbi:MAG: hypothetical protein II340_08615 [Succinivibrio sp.]|nr:hypothetical protein [Succinivibrio sp.]
MSNARYSRKGDLEESANEFRELVTNSLTLTDITRHIVNVDDKTKRVEIPVNEFVKHIEKHLDYFDGIYKLDHVSGLFGMNQCLLYSLDLSNEIFFENKKVYNHISKMPKLDIVDAADFMLDNMDKLREILHFVPKNFNLFKVDNYKKDGAVSFVLRFSHPENSIHGLISTNKWMFKKSVNFYIGDNDRNSFVRVPSSSYPTSILDELRTQFPNLGLKDKLMFYINTLMYILEKPERLQVGTPKGVAPTMFNFILKYLP